MATKTWNAFGLTGGTSGDLDSFDPSVLSNQDRAFVAYSGGLFVYGYDSTATDATSSPNKIRPVNYSGSGVWLLLTVNLANNPGEVLSFATDTVPEGFLECNGATISRAIYSSLFTAIGTTYGVGDGSATFEIPDYRGEFLRGWDHTAGNDPDAATRTDSGDGSTTGDNVGTKQAGQIEAHVHGGVKIHGGSPYQFNTNVNSLGSTVDTDSFGGNQTNPRNVNVIFGIRY